MRIKLVMDVPSKVLPIDYRRKIMMMIKMSLSEIDKELFHDLFSSNQMKHYTFSVFLPNAKFVQNKVYLKDKSQLLVNFSTNNAEILLHFYNVFQELKNKVIDWGDETGEVKVIQVNTLSTPKINEKTVICRTLSPIICRDHNRETRKDWFFDYRDKEFQEILRRNLKIKLTDKLGPHVVYDIDKLEIEPLAMKQTVVSHYEKKINVSLGRLKLSGEPYLLEELISNGLGSMCGSGFGLLEKI